MHNGFARPLRCAGRMKALLIVLLVVTLAPLAAADPINERPLCEGEPLFDLRECPATYSVHVCGSDDRLMGLGCAIVI